MPGIHHFHLRKSIHLKKEKYPHPDKWINLMDKLIYVFAGFGILMTVPQVTQIWLTQSATGVSPQSWFAYTIVAIFWVVYGLMHKEKPIIFSYTIWAVLDILIVSGALIYA